LARIDRVAPRAIDVRRATLRSPDAACIHDAVRGGVREAAPDRAVIQQSGPKVSAQALGGVTAAARLRRWGPGTAGAVQGAQDRSDHASFVGVREPDAGRPPRQYRRGAPRRKTGWMAWRSRRRCSRGRRFRR